MRGAWAAFAKDPQKGLTTYGWPSYNPSQDTLIRLAYENITGTNVINPYRYDADCVFVNVSSTNSSAYPALPDLGANVTPTATGVSATGSATQTPAPRTSNSAAAGTRSQIGGWLGLGAVVVAYLL